MDVEFELLSLLTEDAYGLWETEVQVPVERDALRHALADLLDRGLVAWFKRAGGAGAVEPWTDEDGPTPDLNSDSVWATPTDDALHVLVSATPKGVAEYFGRAPLTQS